MRKILLTVVSMATVIFFSQAQISCPTAPVRLATQYSLSLQQDSVFVICAGQATQLIGSSFAEGTVNYQWASFSPLTQTWSAQTMQMGESPFVYNGATAGGYRLQVFDMDMTPLGTYYAWVCYVVQPGSVDASEPLVGCGTSVDLNANVVLPTITPYVDPAAPFVPIYPVMSFHWFSLQGTLNAAPNQASQTAEASFNSDTQIVIAPAQPWSQLPCLSAWVDTVDYDFIAPNDVVFVDFPSLLCANTPNFIMQTNYPGTFTGTGVVNGNTGEFSPVVAGAGFFPLTFHSTTPGCNFTKQMVVVVQPFITPTILVPSVVCSVSEPIDLLPSVDGGTWIGEGMIDTVAGIFDPEVSGPGTFQITYWIENSCFGLAYATVAVQQTPTVTINGPDTICYSNGAINLIGSPQAGIWSGAGIVNPTVGYFDPALATSGNNTITYEYNNGTGCSGSAQFTVNVQQPVAVSLAEVSPLCIDSEPIQLTASPAGGVWSGQGITDNVQGIFDPFSAGEGTHNVTYSLENVCDNSDFVAIEIQIPAEITITAPGDFCEYDAPTTLVASPVGGSWTGNGIVNGNSFDPGAANYGQNNLFYTLPDLCASTSGTIARVWAAPLLALNYDNEVCEGPMYDIVATGGDSYTWLDANGDVLQSSGNTYTYTATNDFAFTVQASNNEGCVASLQASVVVNPYAVIVFDVPEVVCVNTPFTISAEGLTDFAWFPTFLFADPHQQTQVLTISEPTTLQLYGFDANGCPAEASTNTVNIAVSTLDLSFTVIDSVYAPGPVTFLPETDGTSVDWFFGNGDSLLNQGPNSTIYGSYPIPGFYEATMVATNGVCTAEYVQEVEVLYPSGILLIPNVITPDGDVYNPGFRLYTQNLSSIDLKIFNRYGHELGKITTLEEDDAIGRAFTGTWLPDGESTGTYFFEFVAKGKDGKDHQREGTFTILRRELDR